jgi:hypothetical protein
MLWRHGDVLIGSAKEIPAGAQRKPGTVLAHGEITGHSHRFSDANAVKLWEHGGQLFVEVIADSATVVHEEHMPITLPRGSYRIWMQREYTPQAIVRVRD